MVDKFTNLVELFEKSCAAFADRPLFGVKRDGTWHWSTFREFEQQVHEVRSGLARLGIRAGDRVAIVANNRPEWAAACYATYGLGAVFVPMYEAQLPAELAFILRDCSAKVVIGSTADVVSKLRGIQGEVPGLEHVIGLELPESDPSSYAALRRAGANAPHSAVRVESSDVAGLIYTSGTTGEPKGVVLTHGNIASNVSAVHELFPVGPEDRTLAFLPWAHSFGQTAELHLAVSMGCSVGINDAVPNLVGNLAEVKPTLLVSVPRIFNRIYDGVNKQMAEKPGAIQGLFRTAVRAATRRSRGESIGMLDSMALGLADKIIFSKIRAKFGGRLRFAISGSAALSKDVAEFIDALGIEVYEGYGLTETSPVVSANYPGHRKIGSVGLPFPGVTVKIDTQVTGHSKQGEIIVYGPNVMRGYYNRPEDNAKVLLPDGGFRTGDMGYLDEDGYLYITGRIKEQYKLENGKYVVPAPLEEDLKLSPYILNVMLYGANQPHNVALVVADEAALKTWAEREGLELGDLNRNPRVKELLAEELDRCGSGFRSYEKPKDFLVITEDFTVENDMLTPSLKLKRRNVLARYEERLLGLYSK